MIDLPNVAELEEHIGIGSVVVIISERGLIDGLDWTLCSRGSFIALGCY